MTPTISGWVLLLTSLAYMAGLFALAWWGDRAKLYPNNARYRALIYSFALGVYASSWTFYGAVGTAKQDGLLASVAGYIGPLILLLVGLPFFERLVRLAKHQNATSISDLLSARFGRSRRIAVLVTLIALTAIIPYISLQLMAISMSFDVLTGAAPGPAPHWYADTTLLIALMLAVFAILFGTRVVDATEHHPGMVVAIAAESLFKLVALLSVGVFALATLDSPVPMLNSLRSMPADLRQPSMFLAQTLTAMFAFFCLPRQFHIGVVECADVADVRRARWWFGGYLVLISVVVFPIVAATLPLEAAGRGAPSADSWVLWLPLSGGHEWLALFAYLGGFSAATGMVIVASVALATMISNDLVLPMLWRWRGTKTGMGLASPLAILWVRRVAILTVLLGAYGFFHLAPNAPSLASVGVLALAAVSQFAPAIVAAVYWPRASRAGVTGGLATGFVIWMYTLLIPNIVAEGGAPHWVIYGPFGIEWLKPHALLGIEFPENFSHGVFWSLTANIAVMVALSRRYRPAIGERLRVAGARLLEGLPGTRGGQLLPGGATVGDLLVLAERLLGAPAARRLLERRSRELKRHVFAEERADLALLQSLERDLSGALGASSARLVLTSALRGAGIELAEIVTLFDEASQKLRFNRELLETMMDNMPQGVCVVNAEMRLVAWNQRYLDLFEYPAGFVFAGKPVEELILFNATRGWCGPGDPEVQVRKRLEFMRAGSVHTSERRRSDGRVIELRGQPLPDGGFVTTFSDVTSHKRTEESLREINETLELRVEERTRQLAAAVAQAEQANQSKTRFVVAASHDLLQPLGAARLFNAALRSRAGQDGDLRGLAESVDNSLAAAGELLEGLLDISRLDAGGVRAEITEFDVGDLMNSLLKQFAPVAAPRGIRLSFVPTRLRVRSDPRLLRRVLQNFIGNALRYTQSGSVVLGARRRAGATIELQVIDTGPGITPENRSAIFEEFRRLDQPSPWGEKGLGLGLSICERIAAILDSTLTLESTPGRGSSFGIRVPSAGAGAAASFSELVEHKIGRAADAPLSARILCVDDDPATLDGLRELLARWGFRVVAVASPEAASALGVDQSIDIVLADYHLQNRPAGLELLERLVHHAPGGQKRAGALLTADATEKLVHEAGKLGFPVLRKPVRPAALRALIAALVDRRARVNQGSSSAGGAN